jgi:hypothetical protein
LLRRNIHMLPLVMTAAKRQKQSPPPAAALQRSITHLRRINAAPVRATVVLR